MTRTRFLTALPLLGVFALVVVGGPGVFLVLATLAGLTCAHEACRLFEAGGARPLRASCYLAVVLLNLAFHDPARLPLEAALAAGVAVAVGQQMLLRGDVESALRSLGATWAVLLLPCTLLAFLVGLRRLEVIGEAGAPLDPVGLVVFLLAVVFGTDIGAYFVGRAFGRLPLAPLVSPKKTVEGFLGGLVAGIATGLLLTWPFPSGLTPYQLVAHGFVLSVAAVLGDLTVSLLKRSAGLKDTGRLLPGHGGLLDRLDGLLFATPLLYLLVTGASDVARGGLP